MGMIGNSLAMGLVSGANIQDGTVETADLKDAAVTASKIAANSVSLDKVARAGTAGQILVSGGPGADPAYQNNPPAFGAGTTMLFVQTAAPTGWTKSTAHNDKSLRVVSGTAGSGGTSAFSSVFGSRTPGGSVSVSGSVGSTTLDSSQIPSHNHLGGSWQIYDAASPNYGSYSASITNPLGRWVGTNTAYLAYTSSTGSGGSHNHSFSGSGSFTGSAMDFAVQYVDTIIAAKD